MWVFFFGFWLLSFLIFGIGFETLMTQVEADTFLMGNMRGMDPCSMSVHNNVSWAASGGFGRGGGACVAGGHGGGADGINF